MAIGVVSQFHISVLIKLSSHSNTPSVPSTTGDLSLREISTFSPPADFPFHTPRLVPYTPYTRTHAGTFIHKTTIPTQQRASYLMVLPVLNRIHCGIGLFCFWALASFCLVRKDLWLCSESISTGTPLITPSRCPPHHLQPTYRHLDGVS